MALPATHMRFALELAGRLPVGSHAAYLAGTLYPDSRWLTGLGREATHADVHLQRRFATTDFRLGWHVHCQCDQIQTSLLRQTFPVLDKLDDTRRWIHLSALKMIQDNGDREAVDMASGMRGLVAFETPNNEDLERIRAYYNGVRDIYAGKTQMRPKDYRRLWEMVGLASERLDAIMKEMKCLSADRENRERVHDLFPKMRAAFIARR